MPPTIDGGDEAVGVGGIETVAGVEEETIRVSDGLVPAGPLRIRSFSDEEEELLDGGSSAPLAPVLDGAPDVGPESLGGSPSPEIFNFTFHSTLIVSHKIIKNDVLIIKEYGILTRDGHTHMFCSFRSR